MILGGIIHGPLLGVWPICTFSFRQARSGLFAPLHDFWRTFRWGASQRCRPMWKLWPFIAQRRDSLQIASPDHLRGSTRRAIQRRFLHALGHYLHVVWPVLFGIL